MSKWKGIIGRGFRSQEFKQYVGTLSFSDWRPQFAVLHKYFGAAARSVWHSAVDETGMRRRLITKTTRAGRRSLVFLAKAANDGNKKRTTLVTTITNETEEAADLQLQQRSSRFSTT